MSYVLAFIIFGLCFIAMAVGLLFAKKVLRKGCSADPSNPDATCACKAKEQSPLDQNDLLKLHPKIKNK
jgi:hypothetical protein